jgi:hypothetical protein
MALDIPESDWKLFRRFHHEALERFCERVLSEVVQLAGDTRKSSHERYVALYQLIRQRDGEIAGAFNDLRRSTAIRQLVAIRSHDVLTEAELARFSPQTRATVQSLLKGLTGE